jgi:hypothetical protein
MVGQSFDLLVARSGVNDAFLVHGGRCPHLETHLFSVYPSFLLALLALGSVIRRRLLWLTIGDDSGVWLGYVAIRLGRCHTFCRILGGVGWIYHCYWSRGIHVWDMNNSKK